MNAKRDENFVPTLTAVDMTDGKTPVNVYADPTTHRLLVDLPGGGAGTVTSVSGVNTTTFNWSIANSTTTPALTLTLLVVDGGTY